MPNRLDTDRVGVLHWVDLHTCDLLLRTPIRFQSYLCAQQTAQIRLSYCRQGILLHNGQPNNKQVAGSGARRD